MLGFRYRGAEAIRRTKKNDRGEVVEHGMLSWKGDADPDTSCNKNVAVSVEAVECLTDFIEGVCCESVAPNEIAEVEKRRNAFNHLGGNMASDSRKIDL